MTETIQKFKQGWCKGCQKIIRFVTHTDYETPKWICTNNGCFHTERKLKEIPQPIKLY